jgi:hypothetical protein
LDRASRSTWWRRPTKVKVRLVEVEKRLAELREQEAQLLRSVNDPATPSLDPAQLQRDMGKRFGRDASR